MGLKNEYLDLISSTNDLLIPSGHIYLCKKKNLFLDLTANKNKHRARHHLFHHKVLS